MQSFELLHYNELFLTIKRGNGVNGKKSNAKPLFLLSIIECIAMGKLVTNVILCYDDNLISTYCALSRYYNEESLAPFVFPYYHMRSSSFYHLEWQDGFTPPIDSRTRTGKYLKEHLKYSFLDDALWRLLQNAENRDFLKKNIINRYFLD